MPASDGRHHHTTQRTRRTTLSAGAAALIMLAAAACTATTTGSATNSSPAPATTAAAASGPAMTLTGAGSTFDAPFFDLAFARYHQAHPSVTIRYSAVGSSAGIAAFTAQHADFGASDVPMTGAEQAAAHGGTSVQVPVDLGAEVPVCIREACRPDIQLVEVDRLGSQKWWVTLTAGARHQPGWPVLVPSAGPALR